jgi:hypothetical protein
MAHSLPEMANGGPNLPELDPHRFEPANRRRLSGPGLRTFLTIADLWSMNEEQRRLALGFPSRSTYHSCAARFGAAIFWMHDTAPVLLCVGVAVAAWVVPLRWWPDRALSWLDAAGLAAYSVYRAGKALQFASRLCLP